MKLEKIRLDKISLNPYQARRIFDEEKIQGLALSLKQDGLINPVTVRESKTDDGYELVSGERRVRAARVLAWNDITAHIMELSDEQMLVYNLIENLEREELGSIEEAYGYKRLVDEFNFTHERIAKETGKSRSHISNRLRLTELDPFLTTAVLCQTITIWHALAIKSLPDEFLKYRVADLVVDWRLSVKETRKIIQQIKDGDTYITWTREVPSGALLIRFWDHTSLDIALLENLRVEGQKEIVNVFCDGTIFNGFEEYLAACASSRPTITARIYFPIEMLLDDGVPGYPVLSMPGKYPVTPINPPMAQDEKRNMKRFNEQLRMTLDEEALSLEDDHR